MASRAAHAAPELMELGQAVAVGGLHDEGVHVGDVDARLDDGGAHQDVDLPVGHALHDLAQLVLIHLSVGHGDPRLGDALGELRGGAGDGLHMVVQVVDLPAPGQLPVDGVVDHRGGILHHEGLHRVAVLGRLLQGGHVPQAGQGHVQGAGDGRGGQGQHVHAPGDLLEPLLVADAEALLLVHDEQAQVFELDVFAQQLVGADDQIHGAGLHGGDGALLLGGGAEAGEHVDVHREAGEAPDGGGVMLLG